MNRLLPIALLFIFLSCSSEEGSSTISHLKEGTWHGEITLSGNKTMPFLFEVNYDNQDTIINLINASEKIKIDEIHYFSDSVKIPLHIFDAALVGKLNDNKIEGYYTKYYADDYKLPFSASPGISKRFLGPRSNPERFTGKWDITFFEEDTTKKAIGIFNAEGNEVTGTFLLATGDYRYLEGAVINDTMRLSTFDGNHAYLFTSYLENDTTLKGDFWSGKSYHSTWTGKKNSTVTLPSADSLTYLKPGYDKLSFSFPDLDSTMVSPEDFRGKVLILQLFGSWCPNCMDETKFLSKWYQENKDLPVEILGLAYESKDDFQYARSRVLRMKEKLGAQYPFVIAGTSDKEEASKTLPMLNEIISFPTLIFIDAKGNVRKIHTGFTGPGTGVYYEEFKADFNQTVNKLVEELQ